MNYAKAILGALFGDDDKPSRPARRSPASVRPTIGGVPIQGPGLSARDNAYHRRSQGLPTRARNAPNSMSDRNGNATRAFRAVQREYDATELTRRRGGNRAAAARGARPAFTPNLRGVFGLPTTGRDVKPGIRWGDFVPDLAAVEAKRAAEREWRRNLLMGKDADLNESLGLTPENQRNALMGAYGGQALGQIAQGVRAGGWGAGRVASNMADEVRGLRHAPLYPETFGARMSDPVVRNIGRPPMAPTSQFGPAWQNRPLPQDEIVDLIKSIAQGYRIV